MSNLEKLIKLSKRGKKLTCITAYDASFAKYLDDSYIDIILVGDSLGQVIKGDTSTHHVTLDEIIYHSKCVKSGLNKSVLMVDLPKKTYSNKLDAYSNISKVINACGADVVKLEIDEKNINIAEYLIAKKVPLCAHIGLLPQTVKSESDYRKYGKSKKEADMIFDIALKLDEIGVKIILLECIENTLAKKITKNCKAPVIGIGSGNKLDGQVAVIYDLLGISFNKISTLTLKEQPVFQNIIKKFKKDL
jgi:3-methyl-2-oxobutanoate hydroxymethyltransferase